MHNYNYIFSDKLSMCSFDTKHDVYMLLKESDNDFIPPLSCRATPISTDCVDRDERHLEEYLNRLLDFGVIIAKYKSKVIGFLTYIKDDNETYISTIVVAKRYRGKGIANMLCKAIVALSDNNLSIRTWSTNYAQIHILEQLGFTLEKVLENGRRQGINTLYYSYIKDAEELVS